jgi:CubicO group peptidase (beta-lactamase class C family)
VLNRKLLDDALRAAVESGAVPGVVAALSDARGILYEGAFGRAGNARAALAPDTVFRIASMTKVVTSVAVMLLRDEGRLELDAPFAEYLPGYRQPPVLDAFDAATLRYGAHPAARPITIRDLLTHTAGYGYWFLNPELRALTTGAPEYYNPPFLVHEPGARFSYGVSTDVLGQLVLPVSGLTLAQFFERRIFAPLGMAATGFTRPDEARLAAVHAANAAGGFSEEPLATAADGPRGGGALYSTVGDFLALTRVLLNDGASAPADVPQRTQLLEPESVAAMTRNQIGGLVAERQRSCVPQRTADFLFMDGTQKFGFGVLIETHARPSGRAAGSYGWAGIYNTYFWVDRHAGLAAAVFMQTSPFSAPSCIAVCEAFENVVYAAVGKP